MTPLGEIFVEHIRAKGVEGFSADDINDIQALADAAENYYAAQFERHRERMAALTAELEATLRVLDEERARRKEAELHLDGVFNRLAAAETELERLKEWLYKVLTFEAP